MHKQLIVKEIYKYTCEVCGEKSYIEEDILMCEKSHKCKHEKKSII